MGFMRGRVLSGITVILDAPVERPLSGSEFGGANFRFGSDSGQSRFPFQPVITPHFKPRRSAAGGMIWHNVWALKEPNE